MDSESLQAGGDHVQIESGETRELNLDGKIILVPFEDYSDERRLLVTQ